MLRRMTLANAVTDTADLTSLWGGTGIFGLIWYILVAVALWKVFSKAGYPGILAIIPIVNIVVMIIVMLDLAKVHGRGVGFGIGLILLPIMIYHPLQLLVGGWLAGRFAQRPEVA